MRAKSLQPCATLWDPMDDRLPGSSSMGFSRQEYWSRLSFPPSGDLAYPGFEPVSLTSPVLAGRFFITSATSHLIKQPGFRKTKEPTASTQEITLQRRLSLSCPANSVQGLRPDRPLKGRGWEMQSQASMQTVFIQSVRTGSWES